MADVKHTPGPWFLDGYPVKDDPFGRIRYQVVATGKTIAKTYYSSYEGGPTNAEADTRLIAAAPDLLEALKLAYIAMQHMGNYLRDIDALDEDEDAQYDTASKAARAAIAKATGAARATEGGV